MSADATAAGGDAATPPRSNTFPAGIPYIVGNEGAERFSFYGMKSILYIYLVSLAVKFIPEATVAIADMGEARAHGTEIVHTFVAGVYLFPLVGAILSDRLFGKYYVILFVSLIYCAGHAVLAVAGRLGELGNFDGAQWGMYLGLGLIAVGSGGIKPCVSANVGDQFTKANSHLVTAIFQIFYFIINFGSFFSTLITPALYKAYGPEVAFGVPGVLMALATVWFWLGRNKFIRVPASPGGKLGLLDTVSTVLLLSPCFALVLGSLDWRIIATVVAAMAIGAGLFVVRQRVRADDGFLAVLVYSFLHQSERKEGQGFFDPAREKFGVEAGDGPPAVLRIMLVFGMVSVFWALFDQHASTWVEQAKHMNLTFTVPFYLGRYLVGGAVVLSIYGGTWLLLRVSNVDLPRAANFAAMGLVGAGAVVAGVLDLVNGEWFDYEMQAAQLAALNPMMVMAIIPLLNVAIYGPLERRGTPLRPLQKMTIGMFLASAAFVVAAFLQVSIEAAGTGKVHALWQAVPYFIMTTAEVLVSVTGLEFAYTQAPRRMKSTIMGFWLFCVTLGNLLVAFLAPLQKVLALSQFFWIFAALMAGAACIFMLMAYFYRGRAYLQEA